MKRGGFTWGILMALSLSDVPDQERFQHVCSRRWIASQISGHKRVRFALKKKRRKKIGKKAAQKSVDRLKSLDHDTVLTHPEPPSQRP